MRRVDRLICGYMREHMPERIKLLRRLAMWDLYNGTVEGQEGCEEYPGYLKAIDELREYILRDMPSTLYIDEDNFVSDEEPKGGSYTDEDHVTTFDYDAPEFQVVERAAITRAVFGVLVTHGGL